jgi:transcriptional regulator with XRE-family HTH domain
VKHVTLTADSPSRGVFAVGMRRVRKERGLTLAELAVKLGRVSDSQLSKMERGVQVPNLDMADQIAAVLGVTVIDLLTRPAKAGAS